MYTWNHLCYNALYNTMASNGCLYYQNIDTLIQVNLQQRHKKLIVTVSFHSSGLTIDASFITGPLNQYISHLGEAGGGVVPAFSYMTLYIFTQFNINKMHSARFHSVLVTGQLGRLETKQFSFR